MRTKEERFKVFIRRLNLADAANDFSSAFALLERVLNETENEFSGIPFNPERHVSDGRMYPPQEDSRRDVSDRNDLIRYRSGHNTYFSENGAILIINTQGNIYLNKAGADGKKVTL